MKTYYKLGWKAPEYDRNIFYSYQYTSLYEAFSLIYKKGVKTVPNERGTKLYVFLEAEDAVEWLLGHFHPNVCIWKVHGPKRYYPPRGTFLPNSHIAIRESWKKPLMEGLIFPPGTVCVTYVIPISDETLSLLPRGFTQA